MANDSLYIKWGVSSVAFTGTGGLMNALAVLVNGGMMPVFLGKLYSYAFVLDSRHIVMTEGAHLKVLCDFIPVGNLMVASPGDFVLLSGFASLIVCASTLLGETILNYLYK